VNVASWLAAGLLATTVFSVIASGSQQLGLTRINLPYLLGTLITPDRDRARLFGVLLHFVNGLVFSLGYALLFELWEGAGALRGTALGLLHGLAVLVLGFPILPGMHRRMAGEHSGPTVTRQLEPPGFLGLHYGPRTPLFVMLAHAAFGLLLGVLYQP
jgi:hypothetical protein